MSATLGVTAVMLPELDFEEQVALCVALGVTHYTFRPREITENQRGQPYSNWGCHKFDLTPARLAREGPALARTLRGAGLTPFGTVPAADVTDDEGKLQLHFEGAAAADAGRVRVMPPPYPRQPFDYSRLLDDTLRAYERVTAMAERFAVKLVIETHAGSLATSPGLAWNIVRHFDPIRMGVIFDLPNFAREGGVHPALAVSVLQPWIDHCHVGGNRRIDVGRDDAGFRTPADRMCPIEDSDLHVPTWLRTLRDAGVDVPWIIEDYTPDTPGETRLRASVAAVRRMGF